MEPESANGLADASLRERLDELRSFARLLAEGDSLGLLQEIAQTVCTATTSLAVQIERIQTADYVETVVATTDTDGLVGRQEPELNGATRTVIALGHRNERLGGIVLLRTEGAPDVDSTTLERLSDLATFATLALRHRSLALRAGKTRDEWRRIVDDKYRLISGIGEELKERLGVAAEYMQLLDTEGELTEREQHYIERGRHSIDAVVRIIRDLVQLSRIDTGHVTVNSEPTHLSVLLRGIIRDFQLSVGTIGLEFDVAVPDDLPVIVTDIDFVRQVLDTLLSNAVRYSPVAARISIEADIQPGKRRSDPLRYVCVSVSDSGPGIGDEDRIFEEVYRIERRGDKPGFRLAIARRIARLLGGELTLETEKGRGSTFTLWLPDAPPDPAAGHADVRREADAAVPD